MSATSRACRARVEFEERHDTRTNGQRYTAADRRPTNQVSAWQAERGSRPTRRHPREETVSVEVELIAYWIHLQRCSCAAACIANGLGRSTTLRRLAAVLQFLAHVAMQHQCWMSARL